MVFVPETITPFIPGCCSSISDSANRYRAASSSLAAKGTAAPGRPRRRRAAGAPAPRPAACPQTTASGAVGAAGFKRSLSSCEDGGCPKTTLWQSGGRLVAWLSGCGGSGCALTERSCPEEPDAAGKIVEEAFICHGGPPRCAVGGGGACGAARGGFEFRGSDSRLTAGDAERVPAAKRLGHAAGGEFHFLKIVRSLFMFACW
eukprot:COSAG04_NODE_835_length_9985_cov_10.447603_8_plen_203_part_00